MKSLKNDDHSYNIVGSSDWVIGMVQALSDTTKCQLYAASLNKASDGI